MWINVEKFTAGGTPDKDLQQLRADHNMQEVLAHLVVKDGRFTLTVPPHHFKWQVTPSDSRYSANDYSIDVQGFTLSGVVTPTKQTHVVVMRYKPSSVTMTPSTMEATSVHQTYKAGSGFGQVISIQTIGSTNSLVKNDEEESAQLFTYDTQTHQYSTFNIHVYTQGKRTETIQYLNQGRTTDRSKQSEGQIRIAGDFK
jgi:hypothetical protein